jgi:hypothetical protein
MNVLSETRAGTVAQKPAPSTGQTINDDFARGDYADLGANWTPLQTTFKILSQTAQPEDFVSDACERYSGVTWTADQSSEAKVTVVGGTGGSGIGVAARCSASAVTFYRLVIGGSGDWELSWFNAGAFNSLASGNVTYVAGAVIKLSAVGTTITSTYNGSQLEIPRTHSGITSGFPGVAYSSETTSGNLDDWTGKDGL